MNENNNISPIYNMNAEIYGERLKAVGLLLIKVEMLFYFIEQVSFSSECNDKTGALAGNACSIYILLVHW